MPQRAQRQCTAAGCTNSANGGRCPQHHLPEARPKDRWRYNDVKWKRIRASFLKKQPTCCCTDNCTTHPTGPCRQPATVADHVILRRNGGSDRHDNLQPLCGPCHSTKSAKYDGGFGNPRRGG